VTRTEGTQWVAECFWPGVRDEDVRDTDRRVVGVVSEAAGRGEAVDYAGSVRITDDDVVLFLFEGSISAVRQAAERAGIRTTRILHCTRTTAGSGDDPSTSRRHP
jgi:hypothetical protein